MSVRLANSKKAPKHFPLRLKSVESSLLECGRRVHFITDTAVVGAGAPEWVTYERKGPLSVGGGIGVQGGVE